ncbi:MAG: iron ABC transporter permease [Myxococcota bacterium]|nr:iron ABC transporter permease [Myxococcota bacterium]
MTSKLAMVVTACLLILLASPWAGAPLSGEQGRFILLELRIPRVIMGATVGAMLGLTGGVFQALFDNPLATPSTVGTTAGAALGALAVLVLLPATGPGLPLVAIGAFSGALVVTFAIAAIAASGRARINDVLLAGIAISLAAGAITTGLQFQADMASTFEAVRWSLGHLTQVGYEGISLLLPLTAVCCTVLLSQLRALESMIGGESRAHAQGVNVRRTRTLCLTAGALGVGGCVAWCGPIAFVGLIVPHLVRLSVGPARRILFPLSALGGATFLVLCDAIGRVVMPSHDLPVGVITATLGAPLLVWLVARRRR